MLSTFERVKDRSRYYIGKKFLPELRSQSKSHKQMYLGWCLACPCWRSAQWWAPHQTWLAFRKHGSRCKVSPLSWNARKNWQFFSCFWGKLHCALPDRIVRESREQPQMVIVAICAPHVLAINSNAARLNPFIREGKCKFQSREQARRWLCISKMETFPALLLLQHI